MAKINTNTYWLQTRGYVTHYKLRYNRPLVWHRWEITACQLECNQRSLVDVKCAEISAQPSCEDDDVNSTDSNIQNTTHLRL